MSLQKPLGLLRRFCTSRACREVFRDSNGNPDYLRMILLSKVYGAIETTPLDDAVQLNAKVGSPVTFKREDLLPVFSFKLRGAYNMIANLSNEELKKGVITASAGNHAQGVAYSSARLNIPATIVMPTGTPAIKYKNVARMGANVVLYGADFDAAKAECLRLAKENGMTFIPPFDDPYVIAGQGTIGMEIVRQTKDLSKLKAVFCAVGGGGLIAGVGVYLKRVAPHVKVIGVETHDADAMYQSLKAGERVNLPTVGNFADGTAVKQVGEETFRLAHDSKVVDEIVHVSTDELCAAINDIFADTRSISEPSGALSVAGAKKWLEKHPEFKNTDQEVCAIVSGANMNFDRLRFVSERSTLGAGKEVFFIVEMPEQPGSFRSLVDTLAPRTVTEFSYRYNRESPGARVYISFSVDDRNEIGPIVDELSKKGMKAHDLSNNTLAKSHARYMVGGTPKLEDERVFRFEFPERPGALHKFLQEMDLAWNVSMFHYRNNGSDVARILSGIQIPDGKEQETREFLDKVGYRYYAENDNLAYKLCLK